MTRWRAQTSPSPPLFPGPQSTITFRPRRSGKALATACAHESPASSISWSTEKAYSLKSSWSSAMASSWPRSLTPLRLFQAGIPVAQVVEMPLEGVAAAAIFDLNRRSDNGTAADLPNNMASTIVYIKTGYLSRMGFSKLELRCFPKSLSRGLKARGRRWRNVSEVRLV